MTRVAMMVVVGLMAGCIEEVDTSGVDAGMSELRAAPDEEADVDLLWEYDVDTVALECPGNDEDTADSPYTGAWCGFTGGGKTHGCCFGAQCVGPGNSSGTRPGSCCYCILPNGNCGTQPACETQTPKWDCVLGSLAVRLSPWCSQCGGEYGHDAGPDEICKTEDDVY